jgi:CubicO group peptidase (beta-lactamase class C family)
MQKHRTPGLSLAIVKNGKTIKTAGYGLANVELNVAASPETVYQSGSVGKQFTAAAVMLLVEDGKIALDDRITKYLADTPESWKDITVRHLLAHTSGIGNLAPTEINHRLDYTDEELVKKAVAQPLAFAPGERWSYSNTGYILLGIIVKKATGKFYGDFLRERIFAPLKMDAARVISDADIIPNRAAGYHIIKGELKNQPYISPSLNRTADGTLYLTVGDLAKWDAALYTDKLFKKASLEQMFTPAKLTNGKNHPYGFGWFINDVRGHRLIEHGGGWQGFTAHIARYADDGLTIIVLTNAFPADPSGIAHGIAEFYIPALRRAAINLDAKTLDTYAGQYQLAPNLILTVKSEAGKLLLQMGNRSEELFAESEIRFFLKAVDAQITFVRDGQGQVIRLILHQGGVDMEAKKTQ